MVDPNAKKDIEDIAYQLLKSSKSFDKFPTPVTEIIAYANLAVDSGVDLSKTDRSFFSKFDLTKILSKVRGILFREERLIMLDMSQPVPRRNFVMLHECGHDALPWQKAVFDFIDDDNTLDPGIREQFEAEANYFASASLFQIDRFEHEMRNLPIEINSGMYLSKRFGSSIHAALRRYIEVSKKRCALLVLEHHPLAGKQAIYQQRDYFQSSRFTESFGKLQWPEKFGYKWKFVQDYYFNRRKTTGTLNLMTDNGDTQFNYEFFNSTYNGFVLLYPKGENKDLRTKFVVTE